MAQIQFDTDNQANCEAKQALIDAENEAKQLQIVGAGMVGQSVNDFPLATALYPRIISLLRGVEKIDMLISQISTNF